MSNSRKLFATVFWATNCRNTAESVNEGEKVTEYQLTENLPDTFRMSFVKSKKIIAELETHFEGRTWDILSLVANLTAAEICLERIRETA